MNKRLLILVIPIILGVLFTFLLLNNNHIYAKEKYTAIVLQAGAYKSYDKANKYIESINNGIIIKENDLYKVYVGIFHDTDLVNKLLVFYENKGVHIYLKEISISKSYYNNLIKIESIINNNDNNMEEVTKFLLKLYKESVSND